MPVQQALASPAAPAVPALAATEGFPPSHPHPLASELTPAFYPSILSQTGRAVGPSSLLPQAVFPSPLLSCSPPIFQLLPVKLRKQQQQKDNL